MGVKWLDDSLTGKRHTNSFIKKGTSMTGFSDASVEFTKGTPDGKVVLPNGQVLYDPEWDDLARVTCIQDKVTLPTGEETIVTMRLWDDKKEAWKPVEEAPPHSEMLNAARDILDGNRYGGPEKNLGIIAHLWSDYLGVPISPTDVSMLMILLKVARIRTGLPKMDNFIDITGYAGLAADLKKEE